MDIYIPRQLSVINAEGQEDIYSEEEFFDIKGPLVILGEPGLGKTHLVEKFKKDSGSIVVSASSLYRNSQLLEIEFPKRLIIDGLDELPNWEATVWPLLIAHQNPNFVLVCRAFEWNDSRNKGTINQKWNVTPTVGRILLFDKRQVSAYIEARGYSAGNKAIDASLYFLGNPLFLFLYLNAISEGKTAVGTKKDLFENSMEFLVKEKNEEHSKHNNFNTKELIAAAGGSCAQLLLSNTPQIKQEDRPEFKADELTLEAMDAALKTRIFRSKAPGSFEPIHRTIAEFMAAKWLLQQLKSDKNPISPRRLNALFGAHNMVATPLRGLHAWMATLADKDPTPASKNSIRVEFIKRDPYGFINNGDPTILSDEEKEKLLKNLEDFADKNPGFGYGGENSYITKTPWLASDTFKESILRVINSPKMNTSFGVVLIDAIDGGGRHEILENIIKKNGLDQGIRKYAIYALEPGYNPTSLVDMLFKAEDLDSLQVALEIVKNEPKFFAGEKIASLCLNIQKKAEERMVRPTVHIGIWHSLCEKMSEEQLEDALSLFLSSASGTENDDMIQESIGQLSGERLSRGNLPKAKDALKWLKCCLEQNVHYSFKKIFDDKPQYRQELQAEEIKLALDAESLNNTLSSIIQLQFKGVGLSMQEEDALVHLDDFIENRSQYAEDWRPRYRVLLKFFMENDFHSAVERARAYAEDANDEPAIVMLHSLNEEQERANLELIKLTKEWSGKNKELAKLTKTRRQEEFNKRIEQLESIKSGTTADVEFLFLSDYARIFLGLNALFEGNSYKERLIAFFGKDCSADILNLIKSTIENNPLRSMQEMLAFNDGTPTKAYILMAYCQISDRPISDFEIDLKHLSLYCFLKCRFDRYFLEIPENTAVEKSLESLVFEDERQAKLFLREISSKAASEELYSTVYGRLSRRKNLFPLIVDTALFHLETDTEMSNGRLEFFMCQAILCDDTANMKALINKSLLSLDKLSRKAQELWLIAAFLLDYENQKEMLLAYDFEKENIFFFEKMMLDSKFNTHFSAEQISFIIKKFVPLCSLSSSSSEVPSGLNNSWKASFSLYRIWQFFLSARTLTNEELDTLENLTFLENLGDYCDNIKYEIATARQKIVDENLSLENVRDVLFNRKPKNNLDLQNLCLDLLDDLQEKITGGVTMTINRFLEFQKKQKGMPRVTIPSEENDCRDTIVDLLEPYFKRHGINSNPEDRSVENKRTDIRLVLDAIKLPIELKGQWHEDVYTAAKEQLLTYTRETGANGYGIYLVLWFGHNIPDKKPYRLKRLLKNEHSISAPTTAFEMKSILETIHSNLLDRIKFFVLDVSKQAN